jgi:acetolactate decarboxylase
LLAGCGKTTPLVEQHGEMRDALRMGNTQSRISLREVIARPHAFAVGALTDLEGEITIVDGEIIVAKTSDGKTATSSLGGQNESATLLTLSYVDEWVKDVLPPHVDFEKAIELVASKNGIDTNKPFPFYILATTKAFEMHVINGFCPVASPDLPEEDQPWRLHGGKSTMRIVGFFAKDQEGTMTHHGSNVHIHGVDSSGSTMRSGHLDFVEVAAGSTIFLPAQ